jgi:hypothetical protein
MFLEAAAGNIKRAFRINNPTHLMDNITIRAIKTENKFSITLIFTPLLLAKLEFKLKECNLLKHVAKNTSVTAKMITNNPISFGVILNTSPTNKEEYFEKLPPLDNITRPIAVLVEENTEIIVSVDAVLFLLIKLSNNANTTANAMVEMFVSPIPRITPIAIPVKTEWPNASEKNASLLFTIIVPNIPNNGVITKTANNAFFIKL